VWWLRWEIWAEPLRLTLHPPRCVPLGHRRHCASTGHVLLCLAHPDTAIHSLSMQFDRNGHATRALVEDDMARTSNIAACLTNHFVIDFGNPTGRGLDDINAPTLVVHGELDPVFPLGHGQALQPQIPGAELLILEKTGHDVPPAIWDVFVPKLVQHTSA
jgi:pimeloyl-ACP methyl ester carboxylesterase